MCTAIKFCQDAPRPTENVGIIFPRARSSQDPDDISLHGAAIVVRSSGGGVTLLELATVAFQTVLKSQESLYPIIIKFGS